MHLKQHVPKASCIQRPVSKDLYLKHLSKHATHNSFSDTPHTFSTPHTFCISLTFHCLGLTYLCHSNAGPRRNTPATVISVATPRRSHFRRSFICHVVLVLHRTCTPTTSLRPTNNAEEWINTKVQTSHGCSGCFRPHNHYSGRHMDKACHIVGPTIITRVGT